jgi:hypothetical protein
MTIEDDVARANAALPEIIREVVERRDRMKQAGMSDAEIEEVFRAETRANILEILEGDPDISDHMEQNGVTAEQALEMVEFGLSEMRLGNGRGNDEIH